jgi:hypothetical protein
MLSFIIPRVRNCLEKKRLKKQSTTNITPLDSSSFLKAYKVINTYFKKKERKKNIKELTPLM